MGKTAAIDYNKRRLYQYFAMQHKRAKMAYWAA
jgi:hypothetical protein